MNCRRREQTGDLGVHVLGVALACLAAVATTGCSNDSDDSQKSGQGEECSLNKDCKTGLVCREDVCKGGGGGADAGIDGGATDGGTNPDTGPEPEQEDYFISYEIEDQTNPELAGQLWVYSTGEDDHQQVSPDGLSCTSNCWLTRDMEHFVYTEAAGGGLFDVQVVETNGEFPVERPGTTILEDVRDVGVRGNQVTYLQPGDSGGTAFVREIPDGQPQNVGDIGSKGDWFVDVATDTGMLYSVGQSTASMSASFGSATSRESDKTVELGGRNFQRESGSYFGGQILSTVSPDGRVAAFVASAEGAPNNYSYCTRQEQQDAWSSEQCDGDRYFKCGTENRCTRLEVTVHTVDMENRSELGQSCQNSQQCGPYHECYVPSPQRQNEARCIPGRTVLGVPRTNQGPERETSGCKIVAEDDSIDFNGVSGPLSFDQQNNLYVVGTRDRSCLQEDYDTDVSQIVRIDPRERDYEILEGYGVQDGYRAGDCWSQQEDDIDIEDCRVYVGSAITSPQGNELAYTATNPLTMSARQADSATFVWHMLRDGSERWYTGDKEDRATREVKSVRVHPAN